MSPLCFVVAEAAAGGGDQTHVGGTLGRRRAQCGETALILTASHGRADCARLLLDAGADKNAVDEVRASAGGGVRWRCGGGGGLVFEDACHLHFCSQFLV